jgi:hypothetical protein
MSTFIDFLHFEKSKKERKERIRPGMIFWDLGELQLLV